ncbi:MAG: FAD-dependent oxidoreductase [Clostridia bacterium]
MEYLWEKDVALPHFPALDRDISTDVLVIGGGMAGVLCALLLKRSGVKCALVEGATIGSGTTRGTTAVLTAQHDTLYTDLVAHFGAEKAKQYLTANLDAVEAFRRLSRQIPCDFEEAPSVAYSIRDGEKLKREAETVQKLGFPAEFLTKTKLPMPVAGALRYPGMAQFHPLKFLAGAADGLPIYEHTLARVVDGHTVLTSGGRITAQKIIVATHFPFINSRGLYFMKLYQMRSFVVALENAPKLGETYVDIAKDGMYLRNDRDLLLVGGGDHRTGKRGGGFPAVRNFVRRNFPRAREKYCWAAQDCMSLDGVPYIGHYGGASPDIYVATGFNEWGMTSSMVAATVLTDLAMGRENAFAPVFAPQRSVLRAQLLANLGTTLADFALPVPKRCSHMGCALKWNSAERSWDCPCHGSRFDEHGRLIDNPALRDSHVK